MLTVVPEDPRGKHGMYSYVVDDLGVKVYSRDYPEKAKIEFLLNRYAQDSGVASEVFAYQYAQVNINGKYLTRPVIWMRHINGITCDDYAKQLGFNHNPNFTDTECLEWGSTCPAFKPILTKMSEICAQLQTLGFSCCDHCDNWSNYMIEHATGAVKAIDFSLEKLTGNAVLRRITRQYMHHLADGLPERYLDKVMVSFA